jgi:hypothetical protein
MYAQVEKPKENKSRSIANSVAQKKCNGKQIYGFVDNRTEAIVQLKLREMANDSSMVEQKAQIIQKVEIQAVEPPLKTLQQVGYTCYLYASLNSVNFQDEAKYLKGDVHNVIYQLSNMAKGRQKFHESGSPTDLGYKPIKIDQALTSYKGGASIVARYRGEVGEGYVDHALAVVPNNDGSFLVINSSPTEQNLYTADQVSSTFILYQRESSPENQFGPNTTKAINTLLSNIEAKPAKKGRAEKLKNSMIESVQGLKDAINNKVLTIDKADIDYVTRLLKMFPK